MRGTHTAGMKMGLQPFCILHALFSIFISAGCIPRKQRTMPLFENRLDAPHVEELKQKGDVTGLIRALNHKDDYVSILAARALGALRNPQAVEPLCAALYERLAIVR